MRAEEKDHLLLAAYLDGELSPVETIELEQRLEQEPALREELERMEALSASVRRILADAPVPAALGARISERFGAVEVLPRRPVHRSWAALAAALAAGILVGGVAGYGIGGWGKPAGGGTIDALYAGHIRALAAPQPFDIASSDRHVVKPWFNGRTTIAPDAPDLAPEGFPLAGGRIDVVDGVKVPTLVYRRRQHVISVFVLPRTGGSSGFPLRHAGSTIERWDKGDLSYFAVSDLNGAELRQFADLFQAGPSTPPRPAAPG